MKKLRVGVVGVGHIGSNHARLYAEIPSAEFTAVYDVEPFRSSTIASKFGAAAAKSLDDFISMVDAASVATPTSTHYDVARALLAKGKHVLIEKPITETLHRLPSLLIWLPLTLSSCKWGTSNDSIQSWARSKNI